VNRAAVGEDNDGAGLQVGDYVAFEELPLDFVGHEDGDE
jgi:hypothetical protein